MNHHSTSTIDDPSIATLGALSRDEAAVLEGQDVAVLLPCYNEELTIGKVIDDFKRVLPKCRIFVFDNRSRDRSAEIAREHGAEVIYVPLQGKGNVITRMFREIHARWYVMADGDDTYPAEDVGKLLLPLIRGRADMIVGARLADYTQESFRPLHVLGNNLVRSLVNWIFKAKLTDILSGYRAFNAPLAAGLPIASSGFEVETEMTVNALYHHFAIEEVQVPYRERPPGSFSKLRTFSDGFRVLWKIFSLCRSFKPLTSFGVMALLVFAVGVASGWGPVADFIETGYVLKVPRAILATGLMIIAVLLGFAGLLLHAINWRFKEMHSVMLRGGLNRR